MEQFSTYTKAILDRMNSVIDGKPTETRTALTVLLAGGHLLVEGLSVKRCVGSGGSH